MSGRLSKLPIRKMSERLSKLATLKISVIEENILFHIFQELPVKSLMRFKCVSKTWCLIIEDPRFVESRRIRSHKRPGGISLLCYKSFPAERRQAMLLLEPEGDSNHNIELPNPPDFYTRPQLTSPPNIYDRPDGKLARHVEGLICHGNIIWNPSTRKGIKLPYQDGLIPCSHGAADYRIFNEYMLGFDAPSKKYKVLSICNITVEQNGVRGRTVAQVLTLGTNSWRNLDCLPEQTSQGFTVMASCCTNNIIFCLITLCHFSQETNSNTKQFVLVNVLMTFEVGNERFRIIEVPKSCPRNMNFLFEVNGKIAMAIEGDCPPIIWILEDYENKRWRPQNINYPQNGIISLYPFTNDVNINVAPVGTIHTQEILFEMRRNSTSMIPVVFFYYNLETASARLIPPPRIDLELGENIEFSKHVETVFPFKDVYWINM